MLLWHKTHKRACDCRSCSFELPDSWLPISPNYFKCSRQLSETSTNSLCAGSTAHRMTVSIDLSKWPLGAGFFVSLSEWTKATNFIAPNKGEPCGNCANCCCCCRECRLSPEFDPGHGFRLGCIIDCIVFEADQLRLRKKFGTGWCLSIFEILWILLSCRFDKIIYDLKKKISDLFFKPLVAFISIMILN